MSAPNPPLVRTEACSCSPGNHDCPPAVSSEVTLRDLFAAAAMGGFIAGNLHRGFPNLHVDARYAYEAADALLEARSK